MFAGSHVQDLPRYVSVLEAGRRIGIGATTIKALIAKGLLARHSVPGVRRTLIDVKELDALVQSNRIQTVEAGADESLTTATAC
jgi:hypothetical protein